MLEAAFWLRTVVAEEEYMGICDLRREILSVLQFFGKAMEVVANLARTLAINLFPGHVHSETAQHLEVYTHATQHCALFEGNLPKPLASSFGPRSSPCPSSVPSLLILQTPPPTLNKRIQDTQSHISRPALALMCSTQPARKRLCSETGSEIRVATLKLVARSGSEGAPTLWRLVEKWQGSRATAFSCTAMIATRHQ